MCLSKFILVTQLTCKYNSIFITFFLPLNMHKYVCLSTFILVTQLTCKYAIMHIEWKEMCGPCEEGSDLLTTLANPGGATSAHPQWDPILVFACVFTEKCLHERLPSPMENPGSAAEQCVEDCTL